MWVISGRNVDISIQSKMWYLAYFLLWLIDHSNLGQQSLWFSFHGQFFLVHWSSLNQSLTWQTVWNQAGGLLHYKLLWTKIPLRTKVFGVKSVTHLDLWYYMSAILSLWKVIQILSRFIFPKEFFPQEFSLITCEMNLVAQPSLNKNVLIMKSIFALITQK